MLWKSSYKTGIDEIDRQNLDLIKNVEVMMRPDDLGAKLMRLEDFEKLVKKYFEHEQRLHKELSYSDAYWHKIAHEVYIKKLQHVKRNFVETGATLENEKNFRTKVVEFLKNHIACHDRSFAHFYFDNMVYA